MSDTAKKKVGSSRGGKRLRVCVATGTRADYGALRPVMRAIGNTSGLRLQVCVTGMHLLRRFGLTARIVEGDGWPEVFRVRMQRDRDSAAEQALALGRGVDGIARQLRDRQTDVVLVLGDRIEALAGGAGGQPFRSGGRPSARGELATGQQDDAIRHAISKIAHVHLTATAEAAARLARMGEAKWRIHRVGAPALDVLRQMAVPDANWVANLLGMPAPNGFLVVAQHPVCADAAVERRHMTLTLKAAARTQLPALIVWPNTDPGHSGIIAAIEKPPAGLACKVVRSLPHEEFLRALLAASAMVGNSSAGIIEAPAAGTPSVDIGPRQAGRLRDERTVLHGPHNLASIAESLYRALRLKKRLRPHRRTPYGDGQAAGRIADVLRGLRCDTRLLAKQNSY